MALEAQGDFAVLTVHDSGPGIDPGFLPRIFDRFTQEDPSTTRTAGGLGMGLSLVKDLVELHGGDIRARNGENGTGAIFTARFPLPPIERLPQPPATADLAMPSAPLLATPSLDGVRVLVLDRDAPLFPAVVELMLGFWLVKRGMGAFKEGPYSLPDTRAGLKILKGS